MKAEITAEGRILVYPENPVEQYAIKVWCKENVNLNTETIKTENILFHYLPKSP